MLKVEYISRYGEEYYEELLKRNSKHNKELYGENPNYFKVKNKKWRDENPEYNKNYKNKTKRGRANMLLNSYRNSDKEAERDECTLTQDWIVKNIFSKSCIYCGDSDWHNLGCDRIDNSLPHTQDNCVCSCWKCNNERRRIPFDEFVKLKQK